MSRGFQDVFSDLIAKGFCIKISHTGFPLKSRRYTYTLGGMNRMDETDAGPRGGGKEVAMNYTPGPWTVIEPSSVIGEDGSEVADCSNPAFQRETETANSHLVAAAPDLLEALQTIVAECDGGTHDSGTRGMALARTAIAKVKTDD